MVSMVNHQASTRMGIWSQNVIPVAHEIEQANRITQVKPETECVTFKHYLIIVSLLHSSDSTTATTSGACDSSSL